MKLIGIVGRAGSGKDTLSQMILNETGGKRTAFADPFKLFVQSVFDWSHETLWGPSALREVPDWRYGAAGPGFLAGISAGIRARSIDRAWNAAHARFVEHRASFALDIGGSYGGFAAGLALREWFAIRRMGDMLTPRHALQSIGDLGRALNPNTWVDLTMRNVQALKAAGERVVVVSDVRNPNEARAIRDAGGELWKLIRGTYSGRIQGAAAQHSSETNVDSPEVEALVTRRIHNVGTLPWLRELVQHLLHERGVA